jgi:hypothetical protein
MKLLKQKLLLMAVDSSCVAAKVWHLNVNVMRSWQAECNVLWQLRESTGRETIINYRA